MKKLAITSRWGFGRRAHHHIVYLNDDDGRGVASLDPFGGTHEVQWTPPQPEIPEQPEQQDPNTGEIIPAQPGQPAQEGFWQLLPDPEDGHTHEIDGDYETKGKQKKEDDATVIRDVLELWRTATELEMDSKEDADESDEFYDGEQWEEKDRNLLKSLDRACLTINLIAPKVNEISGHQRQSRTDIHYVPVEDGDQRACDLYNVVAKVICEQSNADREESAIAMDQFIRGRGWWNVYADFSKNILGDLRLQRFSDRRVKVGPHEMPDLEDCEYLVKDRMYSKAKMEQLWPDKAEDIGEDFDGIEELGTRHPVYATDNYARGDGSLIVMGGETLVDIAKKEYRVIECWRKVWIDATVAVEAQDEFVQSLYGWEPKDVKLVGTIPGFVVIPRTEQKIRISKIAGGVLLSDENPADLPIDDFFMVPVYAYKRDGRYYGIVEAAKDPQREVNKRRSHAIDIANRMGAAGWGYDDETFADEHEAKRFRQNSTKPGFVVKLGDVNRPPHQFKGEAFPSEMVQLMQMDVENLDRLLNISIREPGANTSAAAIMQAQKMKLIGNEFLFDNQMFAKRKVGILLLHAIRRYYSPQRIYRIVTNQNVKKEIQIGGQPIENYTIEEITDILENADLAKLDTAVTEASYSPTTRIAILTMLQEWAKSGGPVPPQMLVKYFDVPEEEKQSMLQDLEAQAQAQAEQTGSQADAQIEMTLAKQGIFTERVRQMIPQDEPAPEQEMPMDAPPEIPQGGIGEGAPVMPEAPQEPQESELSKVNQRLMDMLQTQMANQQQPRTESPPQPIVLNVDAKQSGRKITRIHRDPTTREIIGAEVLDDETQV